MTKTPARNKVEEVKEVQKAEIGVQKALEAVRGLKLVFDTNILYKMFGNQELPKRAVKLIAASSNPILCETVFWEYLRNCSLEKFRKRSEFLHEGGLTTIDYGNTEVKEVRTMLWLIYLKALDSNQEECWQ